MRRGRWLALGIMLCAATGAWGAVDPGVATAPRMEFTPLPAGTYTLQRIQRVADATLVEAGGQSQRLSAVTTSKVTLLTFFYTYCVDPLGCPFASKVLADLRARLLDDGQLAQRVRFVSVSLDPTTDTPAALARYRDFVAADQRLEWRFLTARSVGQLLPVLDDFGQDVSVERGADGSATRTLHHMLKMFLIDERGVVREIYTLSYLQPEVMFNDIRTLLLEAPRTPESRS